MTSPEAAPEPAARNAFWGGIVGVSLIPGVLYAAAVLVMGAMYGQSSDSVLCFDPDRTPVSRVDRQLAAGVAVLSAIGFLFIAPGVLGTMAVGAWSKRSRTPHVWSLCVNTLALMLLFWTLRATVGVSRISFALSWIFWTLLLAAFAYQGVPRTAFARPLREGGMQAAIGLVFVLASAGCFFPEQFLQCFNEDGTEAFELAKSLRSSVIPTWEIETGEMNEEVRYGPVVVNPSLINSYWTAALQVLLGDGELATRLPYWAWWLGIYFMGLRLIRLARSGPIDWIDSALMGLLMFLVSLMFSFYVGYNPYMADLANPGVTNALFTLCFLMMLECLFNQDRFGFAAAAIMASLVFYSGLAMLGLVLAAAWVWKPIPRIEIWRWGRLSALLLALIGGGYVIYGISQGVLGLWIDALQVEYVSDYLAPVPRWQSAPLFLGYFVLGSGGVAVWGLVWAFRQGPWQRTVATATCGYLAIVLLSGFKNLHYLGPLLPVPLILWLASRPAERWKLRLVVGCSLLVCVAFSWPIGRQAFVLNRQFGEQTTFATDSYSEAIQWARVRYGMQSSEVLSWDCDQHTWVAYAELDRETIQPGPLLVTLDSPPSPEYRLFVIGGQNGAGRTIRLYTRNPKMKTWLASQKPLRPLERYPFVFRPLADGRFSPHRNILE